MAEPTRSLPARPDSRPADSHGLLRLAVRVVTPERSVFDGKASEVLVPAWEGELGVYPDHDQLLCLVRAGTCRVSASDGPVSFVIGRGFAEIGPDRVTILTDSAEDIGHIDRATAAKDLEHAAAEMVAHDASTEKHRQAQIQYELARARLEA